MKDLMDGDGHCFALSEIIKRRKLNQDSKNTSVKSGNDKVKSFDATFAWYAICRLSQEHLSIDL